MPPTSLLQGFHTTHWTEVRRAEQNDHASVQAREALCRDYWYPIYAYLRKLGYDQDAEDLTQDFLMDILRRNWLAQADPDKGKFRSFLLSSLNLFLRDVADRRRAAKRQGAYLHVPFDTADAASLYAQSRTASVDPAQSYEVEWATAIINHALRRLKEEYTEAGKLDHYSVLKTYLKSDGNADGYRAAADALGTTTANVKVRVHRLRQRLGMFLQEEVARTIGSQEEIEEEMVHLRAVFSAVAA